MSGERVFLDTNVIVYAYDRDAGRKHEIAKALLIDLWNAQGGVLSTQVLQEFYVTVTKKVASPLPPESAREIVEDYLTWEVVTNDGEAVLEAIDIQVSEKISFWDALVVAAARKGGADILLSEDLADGRKFGDVSVRNPFGHS
jgi:predicted nucleic acid-binding protein